MAEETAVTEMTPVMPAETGEPPKVSPFGAPAAPATSAAPAAPAESKEPAPAADASSAPATPSTIRLKPVIRKPMIRKPMAPAARPPAAPAPKASTGNLKSVTGPIPAQAVLKKTGIVAEGILTPAQAQAAKSKTSRISLESAIGVAPAKEAPAPLKTIRLRRPSDLKSGATAPSPLSPAGTKKIHKPADLVSPAEPAPDTAAAPAENQDPATAATVAGEDAGVTQKKTLKLHRPGTNVRKPSLGIKKPGVSVASPAPADGDGEIKDLSPAELGDVPELKPLTVADMADDSGSQSAGVPGWVMTISVITTLAALVLIGFVAFFLAQEGCGPDAGENAMAFIVSE